MQRSYDVAAYLWPSYHYEPRVADAFGIWPEQEGEWYTVRRGSCRFPGHDMPRVPLLGYQDEADPAVMRQHVELAREHGVNVFIVDWYWYENAPCFERQLNEAILPALEGTDSKFYLMWANHDAGTLWDMHLDHPDRTIWSGQVSRDVLEPMFDRVIDKYLTHPNYYRVAGKPVFSIFDCPNLSLGLGGIEATAAAFVWMRRRCTERGLAGLELQDIVRGGHSFDRETVAAARAFGFDSGTAYQYCMESGGSSDYVTWAEQAIRRWAGHEMVYGTYYPHVSIGWDNTQRYPSAGQESVINHSTPDAFEACLWKAKQWLDARPTKTPLVTINSWNEWTEGSYLLPDLRWGYRYLRAVRSVFGGR